MNKVRFIARKEIYHILRDPRSLLVIFAMPVLMTFLYGFAIDLDIVGQHDIGDVRHPVHQCFQAFLKGSVLWGGFIFNTALLNLVYLISD